MPNRLAHESSLYLLQHKDNPVDWMPWTDEIFEKARKEDKPILLSIGYSACHWCHVMAHESFEDDATAALMNEYFVNVKVDREEHPNIDSIYMSAVVALTGHGGWPLTVFLTPEGNPFYGGTYFPNRDMGRMPSFRRVLNSVQGAWQHERSATMKNAESLTKVIASHMDERRVIGQVEEGLIDASAVSLLRGLDEVNGGFGTAPKFPQPAMLEFLLRHWHRTGNSRSLNAVVITLDRMARGGIHDQIGGGFARYSTDEKWFVPHFEKMLYDNALLARVYFHAWQATGNDYFASVAESILSYIQADLSNSRGGFFSSRDADSEGREGIFYLWTPEMLHTVLGEDTGRLASDWWEVTDIGDFEGMSVLKHPHSLAEMSRKWGTTEDELRETILNAQEKLLVERRKRTPPARDEKIITGWNGMAIAAFAECGASFGKKEWVEQARKCASFLLTNLVDDSGRLMRTWTEKHGMKHAAALEDYAFSIDALTVLWEATFERRWLESAERLAHDMLRLFYSPEKSIFYDAGVDSSTLIVRPGNFEDGAMPCGASEAAMSLLRLGHLTGISEFTETAESVVKGVKAWMERAPGATTHWLSATDFMLGPVREIVISGPWDSDITQRLILAARENLAPRQVLAWVDGTESATRWPLLHNRGVVEGKPAAYICYGYSCKAPITEVEEFRQVLKSKSYPDHSR